MLESECTNLIVLNGINVFPFTYLVASRGGSVVDYVLMKAYELSMMNAFNIGPLSLDSDHKPLYLDHTLSNSINNVEE